MPEIRIQGRVFRAKEQTLQESSEIVRKIFQLDDGVTENDYSDDIDFEYIDELQDIIDMMETGRISKYLLSIDRKQLQMAVNYFDIPTYKDSFDYPDFVLEQAVYQSWYRYSVNKQSRLEKDNSELVPIGDQDIETLKTNYLLKSTFYGYEEVEATRLNEAMRKSIAHRLTKIEKSLGNYKKNVLMQRAKNPASRTSNYIDKESYGNYTEDFLRQMFNASRYHQSVDIAELNRFFDGTVVVAGGSLMDFFSIGYVKNDIDFFFVDVSPDQALEKVKEFAKILVNLEREIYFVRTSNSITIKQKYDDFCYQFILRLYSSKQQIVMGFDMSASSILFDGKKFLSTKLSKYSLQTLVNFCFPTMQGKNSPQRMYKYVKEKMFSIYIAELHTSLIPQSLDRPCSYISGGAGSFINAWNKQEKLILSDYGAIHPSQSFSTVLYAISQAKDSAQTITGVFSILQVDGAEPKDKFSRIGIRGNTIVSLNFTNLVKKFEFSSWTPLTFMTQSPGSQFTGSFEKSVYNNYIQWYRVEETIEKGSKETLASAIDYIKLFSSTHRRKISNYNLVRDSSMSAARFIRNSDFFAAQRPALEGYICWVKVKFGFDRTLLRRLWDYATKSKLSSAYTFSNAVWDKPVLKRPFIANLLVHKTTMFDSKRYSSTERIWCPLNNKARRIAFTKLTEMDRAVCEQFLLEEIMDLKTDSSSKRNLEDLFDRYMTQLYPDYNREHSEKTIEINKVCPHISADDWEETGSVRSEVLSEGSEELISSDEDQSEDLSEGSDDDSAISDSD